MKPKYEFLNKYLKRRSFYIIVLIFSLVMLNIIYAYYTSGEFVDESLRQTIMVGWAVWIQWFVTSVALFAIFWLMVQIIFSDLSRRVKLGALMLHFGFALSFVQIALIYQIGSSALWVSRTILMMCYINLLCFAIGVGLLKFGARAVIEKQN